MSSLIDSASRNFAKLSFKSGYDGATIETTFTVSPDPGQPKFQRTHKVPKTKNLQKRLTPEELTALDTLADEAVAKTVASLIEKNMYDESWICGDSLAHVREHYDDLLEENLDDARIRLSTKLKTLHPPRDSFCQCEEHTVNGRSLSKRNFAVVTRYNEDKCSSKYHHVTKPTVLRPPFTYLTPDQTASHMRFLETCNTRAQDILSEGQKPRAGGTLLNAIKTMRDNETAYQDLRWIALGPEKGSEWVPFVKQGESIRGKRKQELYHPISLGSTTDSSESSPEPMYMLDEKTWQKAIAKVKAWPFLPDKSGTEELASGIREPAEYRSWVEEVELTPELAALKSA